MNSPHPYRTSSRPRALLVIALAPMIASFTITMLTGPRDAGAAPPAIPLTASDLDVMDHFGAHVAIENGIAVISSPNDDDAFSLSGSAYVFVRDQTNWIEQKKLTASNPGENDFFGTSVAISFRTIVVGAPYNNDQGSAYVFVQNGTNWTQQARFSAIGPRLDDTFGWSVAISADTVLVGVPADEGPCPDRHCNTGSVYVFVRFHNNWVLQEILTASDAQNRDQFGNVVAIDGNTAVIATSGTSRAVYVFVRNGTTWSQQAKLLPSDSGPGFGFDISIHRNTILIGAPFANDVGNTAGKAYVFVRNGTNWTEQAQLFASNAADFDLFGQTVSVNGNKALIGTLTGANNGNAAAYLFVRNGTNWTEQTILTAPTPGDDHFGQSVALSGGTALVGAPFKDNSGAAYVFPFNPAPQVNIDVVDATASEPGTDSGQFRVRRTGNVAGALRVYYQVSGTATPGADYTPLRGFATIAPGKPEQLFRVNPIDNASPEPNETVRVTLLPDPGYEIGPGNQAQIVITDDD